MSKDMPEYSAGAMAALDIFYDDFNDISFYFEDEDQQNLYMEILKKFFPSIKIEQIFPLNGKDSVISHLLDEGNSELKNRIYVVDKDFDDLLGKIQKHDNLFYLDFFCIENYLLDTKALVEVIIENNPKVSRAEINELIDFDAFFGKCFPILRKLYITYFFVQLHELPTRNTSTSVEVFCDRKKFWKLLDSEINAYMHEVSLLAHTVLDNYNEDDNFLNRSELEVAVKLENNHLVCGKAISKLFYHLVSDKFNMGTTTFDSFQYRLSKNCEFKALEPVIARIANYLNQAGFSV